MVNVQNSRRFGSGHRLDQVSSGATLQVRPTSMPRRLTLNGTGFGNFGALPQGALVKQANSNTYAGDITTGNVGLTWYHPARAANSGTSRCHRRPNADPDGPVSGTDLTKVAPAPWRCSRPIPTRATRQSVRHARAVQHQRLHRQRHGQRHGDQRGLHGGISA